MTDEKMCQIIGDYCDKQLNCNYCKIQSVCSSFSGCFELRPDKIKEAYEILITPKAEYKETDTNMKTVDHPSHYNREGAMECIDEMILVFGIEAVKNFCLCNWLKYRYRSADKNGEEDIQKSDWYLRKYKELCDGTENI